MIFNEDNRVKLPVPFIKDSTVLFVDSPAGAFHSFIEKNKIQLIIRFRGAGYTFLYLPDMVDRLSPEMVQYLFPGKKDGILAEDLYRNIRETGRLGNDAGFFYREGGLTYFHIIPESTEGSASEAVDRFVSFLTERCENDLYEPTGNTRFRERESEYSIPKESIDASEISGSRKIRFRKIFGTSKSPEVITLDPRKQALVDAWKRFEREFGVTPEDLDFLFCYSIKLSRLYITTSNSIFLPDWDGEPEVKMDDLTKSLYFFYLRHPEGVAFKDLVDYEDEVYQIYLGITGRDDLRGIHKTVAGLVSPYSDVRNSCVSRIKKAFKDIVDDRIAKSYYIGGQAGGLRTVDLDRDFVIWEH